MVERTHLAVSSRHTLSLLVEDVPRPNVDRERPSALRALPPLLVGTEVSQVHQPPEICRLTATKKNMVHALNDPGVYICTGRPECWERGSGCAG